jgi:hypothetical protein
VLLGSGWITDKTVEAYFYVVFRRIYADSDEGGHGYSSTEQEMKPMQDRLTGFF